ncbi:hypothetical protein Nepgr_008359 [Nepenthes gracilis]|uniref:peptidylprolyl isomerase n=1 Tax=Nepenthes gracilis TaxID=150966 RepID=A0AAD3S901_NEPGR|nr:hypothetical protein Nepgr_008359 [Nepenthes gracilis]
METLLIFGLLKQQNRKKEKHYCCYELEGVGVRYRLGLDLHLRIAPEVRRAGESLDEIPVKDICKDGGIFKQILKEGKGYDRPNDGAVVKVKLIGKPQDDTVFVREDHGDGDELLKVKAEEEQVIEGLDRAVMTIKKGEMALLTIAPKYDFDSLGFQHELVCSILAGLWGIGAGSTILTEKVHTINTTKVANGGAVQLGAILLIFFSFLEKVSGLLASLPQALAASVLCFIWILIMAFGFSIFPYNPMRPKLSISQAVEIATDFNSKQYFVTPSKHFNLQAPKQFLLNLQAIEMEIGGIGRVHSKQACLPSFPHRFQWKE